MTNRQWLETLNDEQFVNWLVDDYEFLKYGTTCTHLGVLDWLKQEHIDKSQAKIYSLRTDGKGRLFVI